MPGTNRTNSARHFESFLTQTAAGSEKFVDNVFFVWPASTARGASKKVSKEVVKSTIRFLAPEEEKHREPK